MINKIKGGIIMPREEMHEDLYKEMKDYVDTFDDDKENNREEDDEYYDNRYIYKNYQILSEALKAYDPIEITTIGALLPKNYDPDSISDDYDNAEFYSEKFRSIDDIVEKLEDDGFMVTSLPEDFEMASLDFHAEDEDLEIEGWMSQNNNYRVIFVFAILEDSYYPFATIMNDDGKIIKNKDKKKPNIINLKIPFISNSFL